MYLLISHSYLSSLYLYIVFCHIQISWEGNIKLFAFETYSQEYKSPYLLQDKQLLLNLYYETNICNIVFIIYNGP